MLFPRLHALSRKHYECISRCADAIYFPYNWDFVLSRNLSDLKVEDASLLGSVGWAHLFLQKPMLGVGS